MPLARDKFKVPTFPNGVHIQSAMTDDELGKSYNAGLPNIEGNFSSETSIVGPVGTDTTGLSGAFYGKTKRSHSLQSRAITGYDLGFDASLSNPIYKDDINTVQTEAVALRYFVVVATGSINQSQMDWSEWASELASKVDISNMIEVPCIVESYVSEDGLSWYKVWSDGFIQQGGYYSTTGDNKTISFIKSFKNNPLSINLTVVSTSTSQSNDRLTSIYSYDNTGFTKYVFFPMFWTACGY